MVALVCSFAGQWRVCLWRNVPQQQQNGIANWKALSVNSRPVQTLGSLEEVHGGIAIKHLLVGRSGWTKR